MRNIILSLILCNSLLVTAQDSLPAFSVINKGNNRIVISWNNNYKKTAQLTVQRSPDSLTNFKSIVTVPDPMNRQNGYLDSKAENDKMYYRLYILIDGTNFLFSKSKRAVTETSIVKKKEPVITEATDSSVEKVLNKILTQDISENPLTVEEIVLLKKIKSNKLDRIPDSVTRKIDAVLKISSRPKISIPVYRVFSNGDGSVQIGLNDYRQKKYSIRFYEDDDSFLFEIKSITAGSLKLDKSNFYHSGWFKSELFEDGKSIEKNRFFIPKDF